MSARVFSGVLWSALLLTVFGLFILYRQFYVIYEGTVARGVSQSIEFNRVISGLPVSSSDFGGDSLRLVFVGDIMLSRAVGSTTLKSGDWRYPFLKIAEYTRGADLTFGNLEGPVSTRGENHGSIYSFRADPRMIEGLAFAGFDVLSLANNHIWDWGSEALLDTVSLLKEKGIDSVGAGRNEMEANQPVIKDIRGTSFGFLAYTNLYPDSLAAGSSTPGISFFEEVRIKNAVRDLNTKVDVVIVSLHWGEEYQAQANEFQRRFARELVDAGADLIIGHHPHVEQEVEQYKEGWMAYSLGNFIFDQTQSEETMQGLLLEIEIVNKKVQTVRPRPLRILPTFQPELR